MLDEPVRGAVPDRSLFSLSGLEQLRAYMRGLVLPLPITVLLDCLVTEASPGTSVVRQVLSPWFDNGDGNLHLIPIAEVGMYAAALTGAPPAVEVRTINLSFRYLRPCTLEAETVVARSRVLHSGSAFATVETLLEDRLGRTVAHATGSLLLRPLDPTPPPLTAPLQPVEPPLYTTPPPPRRPLPWSRGSWRESVSAVMAQGALAEPSQQIVMPPISNFIDGRAISVSPGRARVAAPASEWFSAFSGLADPALVGTIGELAAALAIASVVEPEVRVLVNHVGHNFLAPVLTAGQQLTADATVRHRGDVVLSEAEVCEPDGTTVAVVQLTCVLREPGPARRARPAEHMLLTVVFTDLVGSTERAERLGPVRWRQVLDDHHNLVRRQLEVHRGREIKCTGDGFLATFDSPTRAVAFGRAVRDGLRRLELEVRVGIHTGECEVLGADVGGLTVHVASRIEGTAKPNEVLLSSTVRDMLAGSGVEFVDRGLHALRGVDVEYHLYGVAEDVRG